MVALNLTQKTPIHTHSKKPASFAPVVYGLKDGIDAVIKTPNGECGDRLKLAR